MNEISNKIDALRAAGFEPIAVLMSVYFYHQICTSQPNYVQSENGVQATATFASEYHGLPIKTILASDKSYSIEVA